MKTQIVGSDIYLTTIEGHTKDRTSTACKKAFEEKKFNLQFSGKDAPIKAVRAIMQKYGIKIEDL